MNNKKNSYKNKRILDISTTPFFKSKGSSLRVDAVLQYLSRENKVDFVTYSMGEEKKYKNVKIYRTAKFFKPEIGVGKISFKKVVLDIFVFNISFRLMLKNRYDIVHCEDFEAAFIGRILHIFWKKPKYVYDLHNRISDNLRIVDTKDGLIKCIEKIEKWVVKCFDLVILNWRLYEKDPLFKDQKKFQLYDRANLELKKYKLPTKRYVAYSGNYNAYQGVEVFLQGYAKEPHKFDVILVGNVSDGIKDLVKYLDIEKHVFYTGFIDIRKSNYILTNAIVCLIPKISEQHRGLKIVHHVMLGKISLATNIEANRELLKDGYNALLYKDDKELDKILRKIDKGYNPEKEMKKGIEETQKSTREIWEYRYFFSNYFRIFQDE